MLLVVLIYKPIKRVISNHLKQYANSIEQKVIEAEGLRKEAEKTFQHYTEQYKTFSEIIASATKHAEENIHALKQQATLQLKKKIKMKQRIQQDRLNLYNKEQTKHIKTAITNKAMILVTCYLKDYHMPNLTKNQVTQLLNTAKNKSITFH